MILKKKKKQKIEENVVKIKEEKTFFGLFKKKTEMEYNGKIVKWENSVGNLYELENFLQLFKIKELKEIFEKTKDIDVRGVAYVAYLIKTGKLKEDNFFDICSEKHPPFFRKYLEKRKIFGCSKDYPYLSALFHLYSLLKLIEEYGPRKDPIFLLIGGECLLELKSRFGIKNIEKIPEIELAELKDDNGVYITEQEKIKINRLFLYVAQKAIKNKNLETFEKLKQWASYTIAHEEFHHIIRKLNRYIPTLHDYSHEEIERKTGFIEEFLAEFVGHLVAFERVKEHAVAYLEAYERSKRVNDKDFEPFAYGSLFSLTFADKIEEGWRIAKNLFDEMVKIRGEEDVRKMYKKLKNILSRYKPDCLYLESATIPYFLFSNEKNIKDKSFALL